jgi:cytochrome c-type biogenesis protein
VVIIPSLLLGLLTAGSPCILPLFPGFLAYLSGTAKKTIGSRKYFLGFFVLAGVLTMMLALGGLIALLAVPFNRLLIFIIPLADAVILILGILLLLDRNPFTAIPQIRVPALRQPFLNAYVYGLLYGPITLPCSGPLVVSIFVLSLSIRDALGTLWTFLWFGIGFGLPLLILSLFSGMFQRQLALLFARHSRLLNVISGLLLIGIAAYDLYTNWGSFRLFLFSRPS